MKLKFAACAILLSLTHSSFALPPKPLKCPSITALKSADISYFEKDSPAKGLWVAGELSNQYETFDTWLFGIGPFKGSNEQEVKELAVAALVSLTFQGGPVQEKDHWMCLYGTSAGVLAFTVTPATPPTLKKYIG